MERIFFTGIKHSGKTTFAKRMAKRYGYLFIDADDLILNKLKGETVRDFYKREGKTAFMVLEAETVKEFIETTEESFVLSLGGGASDNEELMRTMKDNGKIIYLTRRESEMLPVILKHGIPAFLDPNDLEGSFNRIFRVRDEIYKNWADTTIDLGPYRDRDETEEYLYIKLKEHGYGI